MTLVIFCRDLPVCCSKQPSSKLPIMSTQSSRG